MSAAAIAVAAVACKTATTEISGEYSTYNFDIACLAMDPDGTQTLRTWGQGKNRSEAIEQAKKKALEEVLFKGVTAGSGEWDQRPIVTEVNAQQRHEDYFTKFFEDGGEYRNYVWLDEKGTSRIKSESATVENWGMVVSINRDKLRDKLIKDKIIKQQ